MDTCSQPGLTALDHLCYSSPINKLAKAASLGRAVEILTAWESADEAWSYLCRIWLLLLPQIRPHTNLPECVGYLISVGTNRPYRIPRHVDLQFGQKIG